MSKRCMWQWPVLGLALLCLASCDDPTGTLADSEAGLTENVPGAGDREDVHSFANTRVYRGRHIDLDLSVDFERKVISGTADLLFERLTDANLPIVLDTRDLTIVSVQAGTASGLQDTTYTLGEPSDILGVPLRIDLPDNATRVVIQYATSPDAQGLQWLEPAQTAGKQSPYLYSQAQAIQARSFVPLQDTPGVRITYHATVRVPPGLRAVMGARNEPDARLDGVFEFEMLQPIPSYLLAIAVGDIDFRALGPRTGVYAEPEVLDAAVAEFTDTEAMLEATEAIYGPYRWDRYDLLVMPPSFPFGGMENPRISFVTPTLLAGDKSLVSTITHELAHSWSGNLVTNATWSDLWLNEGFTTYITGRILQAVYGDERYQLELALDYSDLVDDLNELDDKDEILAIDLDNRDPDYVFTNIPYDKGRLFLYELEHAVGREAFDSFLRAYFDTFAFRSITTEDLLAYLDDTLLADHPDAIDVARIHEWVYEPGLPDGAPAPASDSLKKISGIRDDWLAGILTADEIDTRSWTYYHWKSFLDGMPPQLSRQQLDELDDTFKLTDSGNSEIACSWLRIAIRNHYEPAYGRLEQFVTTIGRYKFLAVLYKDVMAADLTDMAGRLFAEAKPTYHPYAVRGVEQILQGK